MKLIPNRRAFHKYHFRGGLPQIFRGSSAVETKQIFDDLVATVVSTMVATMVARHHGGHQELHSIQF